MKMTVLVSPAPNGRGFRARSGKPHELAVEAPDREAAYSALAELLHNRDARIELQRVDAPKYHPMFESFGTIDPNAPSTKEYEEAMREYRRQRQAEEEDSVAASSGDAA